MNSKYASDPEYRSRKKEAASRYLASTYRVRGKSWIASLRNGARKRALSDGVPFDADAVNELLGSAPDMCPALGILFAPGGGLKPESPTLDRIRPELGYVRGNIAVISHRANSIKTNATADQVAAVADWMKKVTG